MMHPVQAAPRQRHPNGKTDLFHGRDAPRAGSAEAKVTSDKKVITQIDAPRAGSAEAKWRRLTCR